MAACSVARRTPTGWLRTKRLALKQVGQRMQALEHSVQRVHGAVARIGTAAAQQQAGVAHIHRSMEPIV